MKRVFFGLAFLSAVGGAFAINNKKLADVPVQYRQSNSPLQCSNFTCSDDITQPACTPPAGAVTAFVYQPNGSCNTVISARKKP